MKKTTLLLCCVLAVLTLLLPLGILLSACFGYTFALFSYPAVAIVTALLSVCTVILKSIEKEAASSKLAGILISLLTPLTLINAFFYILKCSNIWVIMGMLICTGCSCYLTYICGKPKVLRVTATLRSTFAREDSRLFAISCNAMRYCFAIVMVFSLSFRFWSR